MHTEGSREHGGFLCPPPLEKSRTDAKDLGGVVAVTMTDAKDLGWSAVAVIRTDVKDLGGVGTSRDKD